MLEVKMNIKLGVIIGCSMICFNNSVAHAIACSGGFHHHEEVSASGATQSAATTRLNSAFTTDDNAHRNYCTTLCTSQGPLCTAKYHSHQTDPVCSESGATSFLNKAISFFQGGGSGFGLWNCHLHGTYDCQCVGAEADGIEPDPLLE